MKNYELKYYPQIDGLRAIAVISVILYHANLNSFLINFSGGFFGVDIFFVISGYLITRIIFLKILEKKFSFYEFYLKRVRRIIPALLVIAAVTYPISFVLFLPNSFLEYIGSLLTGIFFTSNFYFYFSEIDYNSLPSFYKPLIHYWSLSVEEQFYFIFPFTLYFLFKFFRGDLIIIFLFLGLISFIISIYFSIYDSSLAFYLFPTRIWEFLIGSYIFKLHYNGVEINNKKSVLFFQLVGFSLIIISISFYREIIDFFIQVTEESNLNEFNLNILNIILKLFFSHPGVFTLFPILGAFIIIFFINEKNIFNQVLTFQPLVFVGLISYSLYLWHVPIFSFIKISSIDINSFYDQIALIILTFFLSLLTYYFIEKPFRNKSIVNTRKLTIFIVILITFLVTLSLHAIKNDGYSSIVPKFFEEFEVTNKINEPLFKKDKHKILKDNPKIIEIEKDNILDNFLLIGDSHASQFANQLTDILNKRKINLISIDYSNIFSLDLINVDKNQKKHYLKNELDEIFATKKISTIILASRYPVYWNRSGFDGKQGADSKEILNFINFFIDTKNKKKLNVKDRKLIISKSFNNSVSNILNKNINVIIIYPIPEVGFWVPNTLAARLLPKLRLNILKNTFTGNSQPFQMKIEDFITTPYELYIDRNYEVFNMLDKIDHNNLYRIYPHKKFCNSQILNKCVSHTRDKIYYKDDDHLSKEGQKLVLQDLIEVFDKIK